MKHRRHCIVVFCVLTGLLGGHSQNVSDSLLSVSKESPHVKFQNHFYEALKQKATLERVNYSITTESETRRKVLLETRVLNRQLTSYNDDLKNELELKILHKENSIYIDTPFTLDLKKEIRELQHELRQCKKANQ